MKERPILMSAPMVRALLAGTKTQTRRIVKPQPDFVANKGEIVASITSDDCRLGRLGKAILCPYGVPGDRLWVRETFKYDMNTLFYHADEIRPGELSSTITWTPSIHMPRWASRITLELTDVRVERLQEISEVDAMAEGVTIGDCGTGRGTCNDNTCRDPKTYRDAYRALWNEINGPGAWDANPFVWVIVFRRVGL